jgi:serine/threonine protein kinase
MPKRRNIPAFSPPDLKAPRTMMLDHSQHTTLKDWLQTVHQTKKALIVHVNSTLNMKSILAFVYNQYRSFFTEFIKYLFVDIFKLTYQPSSLQVQLDFTFVDNFLKVVLSFRPKAWNLPLYEEDIDIVCSLNVGGSINEFLIKYPIGGGSYGEVFECICTKTGVRYAVKVQDSKSHDHELGVYKQISCHRNVIDVVNSTYQFQVLGEEFACFFMSFCEQGTLQTHISASGIDNRAIIIHFLPPLLHGLNHIHTHGVIHCDIKPTNIVVEGDTPKICDFGLSQQLPEGKSVGQCKQQIFTEWYRPPDDWDVAKSKKFTRSSAEYPYSAFSDLWAMLLTFLHLCSHSQYNSNGRFQIFREGSYNRHNSQEQINSAIDFLFLGRDAPIGGFFKKYLDLQNYERVTRSLTADPHLQSTIVTDALVDLTSLIETFDADEMGMCGDPSMKVTPPHPRSHPPVSTIKEDSDEEDSDEEDSDEEFDYEDSDSN